jgi:Protein of unknown function (DUF3168)
MNLESEIHRRWAADFALASLVPVDRVFTGAAGGAPALPYVVIERLKVAPKVRTSSKTAIDEAGLRLNIWAAGLEQAQAIVRAAAARLERADFPLAEGRVLDVLLADERQQREPDGSWHVAADYRLVHLR